MQLSRTRLDRFVGRMLLVDLDDQPVASTDSRAQRAERAFRFSLVFSGVRCTLQYAILPFVLPLIGIASDAATPIMLAVNIAAIVSIIFSLRRFWQVDYRYKWQYLGVALVALCLLVAFIALDFHSLNIALPVT